MKYQIKLFFTALMFYTRIPCPTWVDHQAEMLNRSTRYFPLIGWIVGGGAGIIFWLFQLVFPVEMAILLSMAFSIFLTGAFHEDGLADVFDGFGGGWTSESILRIMKDSRLGTFGLVGLVLVLAIKFFALTELDPTMIPITLWAGHSVSRLVATTFIFTHQYVREDAESKAKPVSQQISPLEMTIASIFGLLPLALMNNFWVFLSVPILLALKWWLGRFFVRWIGGYTGDCLGATQQLAEILFYLFILAQPWKYF